MYQAWTVVAAVSDAFETGRLAGKGQPTFVAVLGRVGAGADDGEVGRREELASGGLGSHGCAVLASQACCGLSFAWC